MQQWLHEKTEFATVVQGHIAMLGRWRTEIVQCLSRDCCSFEMPSCAEGVDYSEQVPVSGHETQKAQRNTGPVGESIWNLFV